MTTRVGERDAPSPTEERVLKHDIKARVAVVAGDAGPVLEKQYFTSPSLVWRTFGQRSKARREFENLAALVAAGVPCVRPIAYREERHLGCIRGSTLVMEWVEDAPDLLRLLRRKRTPGRREARLELADEYGRLIRTLHQRGFVSTTSVPRNVLLRRAPGREQLILCDQPQLLMLGRSMHATRFASIDVFDVAFAHRRKDLLSRRERYRFLMAYADGDRDMVRRFWGRLSRRTRWTNQFVKRICHAMSRLPIRRFRPRAI